MERHRSYDPERDPGSEPPIGKSPARTAQDVVRVLGSLGIASAQETAVGPLRALGATALSGAVGHHTTTSSTQGGSQVSVQMLKAELAMLRRQADEQIQLANDFLKANRDNMRLVASGLTGSDRQYDKKMISALGAAETSLKRSTSALKHAVEAISRVQNF